jgi:hypothetical protein
VIYRWKAWCGLTLEETVDTKTITASYCSSQFS